MLKLNCPDCGKTIFVLFKSEIDDVGRCYECYVLNKNECFRDVKNKFKKDMCNKKIYRIYVAGPYSANNVLDVLKNIGRGEKVCAELFSLGFAPFCPWHDASYVTDRPDDDFTVQMFYDFSIAWLEVSDAVLVLDGSDNSNGTQAEIKIAKELNIPVFYSIPDLHGGLS